MALANNQYNTNYDSLRVLVLSQYGCGVTALLNALIGQKLIPWRQATDTFVEITFSETPEVIVYLDDSNSEPIHFKINEQSQCDIYPRLNLYYGTSPHESKSVRKFVVKYPLEICKGGIDFVFLPETYLDICKSQNFYPISDFIIYCMDSRRPFCANDEIIIENLLSLGYKSLIFVLTSYDTLLDIDEMKGSNDADDVRRHYTKVLAKYTDLGENGIFFVGSQTALKAKIHNDIVNLNKSNFPQFEHQLTSLFHDFKKKQLF